MSRTTYELHTFETVNEKWNTVSKKSQFHQKMKRAKQIPI